MKKSEAFIGLEALLERREKIVAKKQHNLKVGEEARVDRERMEAEGGCEDPQKVMIYSTLVAKEKLVPGSVAACDAILFEMGAQLREGVMVPSRELMAQAESLLKPHHQQHLAECERTIAPLVKDRPVRTQLAGEVLAASEKGAAILRLEKWANDFAAGSPEEVASSLFALYDALERFEKQYGAAPIQK